MADPTAPTLNCPAPQLHAGAQGMARVAVDDSNARLIVTFERPITPAEQAYTLNPRSYSLTGGQVLFPHVTQATLFNPVDTPPDLQDRRVQLQLDGEGDFSVYTLTVNGPDIDPFFSSHRLRFRLACDEPFDCRVPVAPPSPLPEEPIAIDYLARDYASFRQALLDFVATRFPEWTERSEADIGMMVLELFAATGDTLSYMQDRVSNEAFLDSATQRRSVAGHLALIGYEMDDGASAYTWLQFQVNSVTALPSRPGLRVSNRPRRADEPLTIFETQDATTLRPEHNRMDLYAWDNPQCCLPRTAVSMALLGEYEQLRGGDYVLIQDTKRGYRDVVRLTAGPQIVPADPIKVPGGPITILRWSGATPLHHDYCVPDTAARGNVVIATHGETVIDPLRALTTEQKAQLEAEIAARTPGQRVARQRLRLGRAPLAYLDAGTPATADVAPASRSGIGLRAGGSVSTLSLQVGADVERWSERPTLLESEARDRVFRVEVDDAGEATVVFGDGTFGRRPDETADVTATYRVGGGGAGNVAADTLIVPVPRTGEHIPGVVSVTNPLPASGGRDLETRDHARRFGPATFQKPLVAVTAGDYEAAARELTSSDGTHPIQRATAGFRWTGSWLTVTLAVDPRAAEGLTDDLRAALLRFLDTRRLTGYDLEVTGAIYLPIEVALEICVAAGFRPADVQEVLERALSNADLAGGKKGFFHPDNFSFGDDVYVSRLYAAIMAVPGIESAQITRLARLGAVRPDAETQTNLRQGYLPVGADQIVRLDNDRNARQNGTLTIKPKGMH